MKYALGNMLNGAGGLNPDGLSLDMQFATDKTLTARKGPTPVLTRATVGTFIGSNGLIQSAAIDAARFDHDPVTFACNGLLIEESRTNLTIRSDDFGASEWNSAGARNLTVTTNNTTSPSGAADADLLTVGATTTVYQVVQALPAAGNVTSGTTYTISVFLKANQVTRASVWVGNIVTLPADAIFNLTGSGSVVLTTAGTASIQKYPNDWYRCIITGTAGATSNTTLRIGPASGVSRTYIGNSVDSFWAWGAQLEVGAFPTSYIPTTTAGLARSADVCSITGANFTEMYNQTEGSILINAFTPASGARIVVSADNDSTTEVNKIFTNATLSAVEVVDNGAQQAAILPGSIVANTAFKLASAYKLNDFAASRNGATVVTDAGGTLPTPNQLKIGYGKAGNTMCGCVASLRYYKKRLPDAKLQAITA